MLHRTRWAARAFALNTTAIAALAALAIFGPATTAQAEVGDPAPPLKVSKWVKGEPIGEDLAKDGKVHVIAFFSTDCESCVNNIPMLSDLQSKYKDDAVFVGVSNQPPAELEPFLQAAGDHMNYRVAVDEGGVLLLDKYDALFKSDAIHTIFVIDRKGTVVFDAYSPNQVRMIEKVLGEVVAGTYDVKKTQETAKTMIKAHGLAHAFAALRAAHETETADAVKKQLLEAIGADSMMLVNAASGIVQEPEAGDSKKQYLGAALELLDEGDRLTKGQDSMVIHSMAMIHLLREDLPKGLELEKRALQVSKDPQEKMMFESLIDELEKDLAGGAENPAAANKPAGDNPATEKPAAEKPAAPAAPPTRGAPATRGTPATRGAPATRGTPAPTPTPYVRSAPGAPANRATPAANRRSL